jgi:hypothetical protein
MPDQNNTPPPTDVELKFQNQAMKKMMMERMNSVKGNVRDRLEKVGEQGNVAGTYRPRCEKGWGEPKSNNDSGAKGQGGLIMRILR